MHSLSCYLQIVVVEMFIKFHKYVVSYDCNLTWKLWCKHQDEVIMTMCKCMCLILQYITIICTTTNQAKMKRTNIYDGAIMIFLNDPLVIMLWETWIEKLLTKMSWYMVLPKIFGKLLHICLCPLSGTKESNGGVGESYSSLLLLMMKVIWHFVNNTHKVMITLWIFIFGLQSIVDFSFAISYIFVRNCQNMINNKNYGV